jgi:hypothetical protein
VELQLTVVAEITPDQKQVHLMLTGRLTATNQQMLYPLIHRARNLTPTTEVIIDLTAVEDPEATTVDLLRWEIEHHETNAPCSPTRLVLPEPPTDGPPGTHDDDSLGPGS